MRINLDSPIMVGLTKAWDATVAVMYCLICCIPVVTVGASLTALSYTLMTISRNECGGVTAMFFGKLRREFKLATLAWLVMLAAGAVLAGDVYASWFWAQEDSTMLQIMRGLTIFFALMYLFLSLYLYSGIAKFEVTLAQAFRNALVFAFANLPATLAQLILLAVMALAFYFVNFFAFPIIIIVAYLQAKLCLKSFAPYMPKEDGEEETEEE